VRFTTGKNYAIEPSEDQAAAIADAVHPGSPGIILTGCAGTGKTATASRIAAHYDDSQILAFALTGRASNILNRQVAPADTAHHYYHKHKTQQREMSDNDSDPPVFSGKQLIMADEMSLMPLWLISKLLQAAVENSNVHRFFFGGDPDQLPSVQAGNVLVDLRTAYRELDKLAETESEFTKRLHELQICHRTESLDIYNNAMAIKEGRFADLKLDSPQFRLLPSTGTIKGDALQIFKTAAAHGSGNIQKNLLVLASQNNWVDAVNDVAYELYWSSKDAQERAGSCAARNIVQTCMSGGRAYATSSSSSSITGKRKREEFFYWRDIRIMYRKNDRKHGLKNGEIITVKGYRDEEKITGRIVPLPETEPVLVHQRDRADVVKGKNSKFRRVLIGKPHNGKAGERIYVPLDEVPLHRARVGLAYCVTTNKGQGDEFPDVGVVLTRNETAMVTRAWLYTAITRARLNVYIAACLESLEACVNKPARIRLSDVAPLLIEALQQLRQNLPSFQHSSSSGSQLHQQQIPVLLDPKRAWWRNLVGVKPFTCYDGWDSNVPKETELSSTTTEPSE
jgi:ATP-dependent exoDNAse (exonuclease V) alpha subunit